MHAHKLQVRLHTSYVRIHQRAPLYSAYVSVRLYTAVDLQQMHAHNLAYLSIREHT
jgi:hypothetical protein